MEQKPEYQTGALVKFDDLRQVGGVLAKSGYFKDAADEAKAIVKVLAGQELGIGPVASMTGIHIIQGKPAVGASLMAAMVKRSGKYDFRVTELTDKVCSIEFLQNGQSIGVSAFTAEDAKRAGTQNMSKFPRNMLYARAMSNGVKWFTPDVFTGPIYEPGELGANVDYETGEVIDGEIVEIPSQPAPQNGNGLPARPWDTPTLKKLLQDKAQSYLAHDEEMREVPPAGDGQRGVMNGQVGAFFDKDDDRRRTFFRVMFNVTSTSAMNRADIKATLDWIAKNADTAAQEAVAVVQREMTKDMDNLPGMEAA